ncbi:uncharacterized protein LOC134096007 [Sardina pilchardus]|uniref:uncharacterized protein LOC134096007 n=1 Tax=Sardina pilchardus TaxID=27697 RepID=UPI002E105447
MVDYTHLCYFADVELIKMIYYTLSVVTTTLLIGYRTQNTKAQDIPQHSVKVDPAVIRQSDSVHLTCASSWPPKSKCTFCINPLRLSGCVSEQYSESCTLALSGNNLLTWSHQRGIAEIKLSCLYNAGTQSEPQYSHFSYYSTVTVVGPPQLLVSPQLINEADTLNLACQTPQSSLVSQCFLSVGGKSISVVMPSCQLQSTGKELIHWLGVRPPAQILSLSCYYTVTTTPQLASGPSQPVSVGVQLFTSTDVTEPTSITVVGTGGIWTTVMVIFGVIMFVGGLITSFLCLKTKRCAFLRPRVDDPHVSHANLNETSRSTNTVPGVMGDKDMAMATTAAASEITGLDPDQDSSLDHVYSSIPDAPNSSNHEESPYSVVHDYIHLQSTQQENDIYSTVQMS